MGTNTHHPFGLEMNFHSRSRVKFIVEGRRYLLERRFESAKGLTPKKPLSNGLRCSVEANPEINNLELAIRYSSVKRYITLAIMVTGGESTNRGSTPGVVMANAEGANDSDLCRSGEADSLQMANNFSCASLEIVRGEIRCPPFHCEERIPGEWNDDQEAWTYTKVS